ncbi:MAG: hypothetical protein ACAI44_25445 [Candidatus Sericytochromatia bacterium]
MKILVRASANTAEPVSWIGGRVLGPPELEWPRCSSCEGAMQFLAQIDLGQAGGPDQWLLLFQCHNRPGSCEEWDAYSGGNATLRVARAGSVSITPPDTGEDELISGYDPLTIDEFDARDFGSESEAYTAALEQRGSEVLGKIGGEPQWMVDDETPLCDCGAPMHFAVLLEEGRELSFGNGWALAFFCDSCPAQARLLWQQGG